MGTKVAKSIEKVFKNMIRYWKAMKALKSTGKNNHNLQFNYLNLFSQTMSILKKAISQFELSWNERVKLKLKLKSQEESSKEQDEEAQSTQ